MRVKELMTPSPRTCAVDALGSDAAQIMRSRTAASCLWSIRAARSAAWSPTATCAWPHLRGAQLADIPVWTVMTRDVHTCGVDADLRDAERLMRDTRVRRLPVLDNGGTLVGVLSLGDVAQAVTRGAAARQPGGDGADFMQTVASVSEPRQHARPS